MIGKQLDHELKLALQKELLKGLEILGLSSLIDTRSEAQKKTRKFGSKKILYESKDLNQRLVVYV